MITLTLDSSLLILASILFGSAGIVLLVAKFKPEPPEYQKPKSYNRETESEYQSIIDEHTKL